MTFILLKRESKYSESKREMKTNKYRNGQTGYSNGYIKD